MPLKLMGVSYNNPAGARTLTGLLRHSPKCTSMHQLGLRFCGFTIHFVAATAALLGSCNNGNYGTSLQSWAVLMRIRDVVYMCVIRVHIYTHL